MASAEGVMQSSFSMETSSDDEEDNDDKIEEMVEDPVEEPVKSKPCPKSRKPKNYSAPTFDDDQNSNNAANVGDTDGDGQHSSDEDNVSKSNAMSAIANNSQAVADKNVKSEDKNDGDISENRDEINSVHERVRTPAEKKIHQTPKLITSRRGRKVQPKKAQGKGGRAASKTPPVRGRTQNQNSNKAKDGTPKPPARTPKPRDAKGKKREATVKEDVDPPYKRKRVSQK